MLKPPRGSTRFGAVIEETVGTCEKETKRTEGRFGAETKQMEGRFGADRKQTDGG